MVNITQVLDIDKLFTAWLKVKDNQGCAGIKKKGMLVFLS